MVKFISMDLYKTLLFSYIQLFKNAVLISDRFHIVLQFRNALDKTKIYICKSLIKIMKNLKNIGNCSLKINMT